MKKLLVLNLLILTCCCEQSFKIDLNVDNKEKVIDYPDDKMKWEDMFNKTESSYFVYVFSYDCFYCKEIKNDVIEFSNSSNDAFYFIEYEKTIPISNDVEKTVGKRKIEDIFIKGTPSLIFIENRQISLNVAGKSGVLEIISLHKNN